MPAADSSRDTLLHHFAALPTTPRDAAAKQQGNESNQNDDMAESEASNTSESNTSEDVSSEGKADQQTRNNTGVAPDKVNTRRSLLDYFPPLPQVNKARARLVQLASGNTNRNRATTTMRMR